MAGNRWGLSQEDLDGSVKVDANKEGSGKVEKIDLSDKSESNNDSSIDTTSAQVDNFADETAQSIDENQIGITGNKYEIRDEEVEGQQSDSTDDNNNESNNDSKVENKSGEDQEKNVDTEKQTEEGKTEEVDLNPYSKVMQDLVNNDVIDYEEERDYSGSPEELAEMIENTAERKGEEKFNSLIESVEDRRSREVLEAIKKGASFNDAIAIAQEEDFSSWDLKNINNQAEAVGLFLEKTNPNDDHATIKAKVQAFHKSGILESEAKKAVEELSKMQENNKKSYFDSIEKEREEENLRIQEEAESFKKDLLERTEIANFPLEKNEAKELYDFISLEDENGKTAFEKKEEENKDSKLLYALFLKRGMNKNSFTKEIQRKESFRIKKQIDNHQDSKVNIKGNSQRKDDSDGYVSIGEFGGFNYHNND